MLKPRSPIPFDAAGAVSHGRREALGFAVAALVPLALDAQALEGAASCEATSPRERVPLVELYTSEGCDSCPPADRWLSSLRGRDDVIALAFHVDYWDRLGWTDRFGHARHTERQRWLAQFGASKFVYTPEVAVAGREWQRWRGGDPARVVAPLRSAPVLRLRARAGARIDADVQVQGLYPGSAPRVFIALWQNGLVSQVRAGENRGATLQHDFVVRALSEALDPAAARASFRLPAEFDAAQAGLAAFMQDLRTGEVLQAVSVPLCAGKIG